jgi:type III pantothenate kinase
MPILYDNPKEVGADRIADAVAAWDLYGGPTIVVDFGTATTVEVISAKGEYLGGAIFPGLEVAFDALYSRAAGLRRVELGEPPPSAIGKNTSGSIRAGAVYGYAALVDGLCRRVEDEVGPCTVVSTGGLGSLIAPLSECIEHHEPWLMLHGLRLVYQMNMP